MGVCFVAYAVSDQNIDAILADPPLVWRVVSQEDDSSYLNALKAASRRSLLDRLLGRTPVLLEPKTLLLDEPQQHFVDLDKSWDGLNRVLAALTPSAPDFFDAPQCPGGIEVGYSPALYQRSPVVAQVAAAWADISMDDLTRALQSVDFRGAYLDGVWLRRDEEALSYLKENFILLQAFVVHARRHGLGALIQMT